MFEKTSDEILIYPEDAERLEIIRCIHEIKDETFDSTFIESIQETLDINQKITGNQYNALVNIYNMLRNKQHKLKKYST